LYENKNWDFGLGGVGGYFGGLLAKAYFESDAIEIARGETQKLIAKMD
jgi:2-dehydropantoate 2-reductase